MKKKILFIAHLNSHLTEFFHLAKLCRREKSGYLVLLVFFDGFERISPKSILACHQAGLEALDKFGKHLVDLHDSAKLNLSRQKLPLPEKIVAILKRVPPSYLIGRFFFNLNQPFRYYLWLKNKIAISEHLLKEIRPDIIVLPEENQEFQTGAIVRAAKELEIPTVILPYTIANETESAEAFYGLPSHSFRGLNKLVARRYSKWIYKYKEKQLVLLPWFKILATEKLGLTYPRPWLINSGFADAVVVENHAMMAYYLKNGLPKKKLILTGSSSDDILKQHLDQAKEDLSRLRKDYNLIKDKPIILCALPPSQFPRPVCDFPDYQSLITFWIEELLKLKNFEVVFALHPRTQPAEVEFIKKLGAKIVKQNVSELIPLCDFYIASISATIRWAIACGKPVVNYDVYRYHYSDYDSAKGVITMNTRKEFTGTLEKIDRDQKFRDQLKKEQQQIAKNWGMLDGKSGQRILETVASLIYEKSHGYKK